MSDKGLQEGEMAKSQTEKVLVLGAGNFGTCLAQHLAEQGHLVTLWTRSASQAQAINESNRNPTYLSSFTLHSNVKASTQLSSDLLKDCSVVLQAIPTQAMRHVLSGLKSAWNDDLLLICAAKGIERGTLQLPSGIIAAVLGEDVAHKSVFLSGPSFASEVAGRQPTCVVAASFELARARLAQRILHASQFRVYTGDDPIGLEIAGALKNVVAIAAGASVGLGFQMNSLAALITRGLAEITRVGTKLGANPLTFQGLGGVGDLFLTCTSNKSRNYTVGYRLGKGEKLDDVLGSMGSVAEGVATAQAAYDLTQKIQVDAPIITEVWRCLYEQKQINSAVTDLLTREAKPELLGIR